jgi:hypothetical protein
VKGGRETPALLGPLERANISHRQNPLDAFKVYKRTWVVGLSVLLSCHELLCSHGADLMLSCCIARLVKLIWEMHAEYFSDILVIQVP